MDYTKKINTIIDNLKLPEEMEDNKEIIKSRFVEEVSLYEKKRDHTKKYYNIFRFIVTIGSIFLPAILSMGQMDPTKLPKNFDQVTYWSSWSISLMVTISNGFLQLFSLDKNYFNYSIVVEQLKTEGWQYFGLSGKYEEYDTHTKEAYKEFCKAIENIKRKQIEQEFQGKGNNTKKKENKDIKDKDKENHKTPLLKDNNLETPENLIGTAKNITAEDNTILKPLTDTLDTIGDIEDIIQNTKNNININLNEENDEKVIRESQSIQSRLMLKLSSMRLILERSRNIDLKDIYKN